MHGVPVMSQYQDPDWESYIAFLLQPKRYFTEI